MDQLVQRYLTSSIAPSTASTYRSAINHYLSFCSQFRVSPLPLSQITVSRFIAHLAHSGVSHPSIRSYLSGLRFLQVMRGLPDPELSSSPLISYLLRGIRRLPSTNPRPPRLPITPQILCSLFCTWSTWPEESRFDASMLWAACCLGFFWLPPVRGIHLPLTGGLQVAHAWPTRCDSRLSPQPFKGVSFPPPIKV